MFFMRTIVLLVPILFFANTSSPQVSRHVASKPVAVSAHLPGAVFPALKSIDPEHIRAHVRFLSHDLLEGRGTGQRGGDIAAEYIATQFGLYGLEPAGDMNPGGEKKTFFQNVPLIGITPAPETTFELVPNKGEPLRLTAQEQYVAYDKTQRPSSEVDGEIVYVGYGIEAPEYQWDDYKGADLRGKVLLMLVNEPPSNDPNFRSEEHTS